MKEKRFEVGDMVMIHNHLEFNGEVGIIMEEFEESDTPYYRDQYKIFFRDKVLWFHSFELRLVE